MKHFYLLPFLVVSFLNYCISPHSLSNRIQLSIFEQELYESYTHKELLQMGLYYKWSGDVHSALCYLKAALKKKPLSPEANWHLGDCYLLLGDYERGFIGFNWRWLEDPRYKNRLWQGEDLHNKKILIYCQWGFGDTFMYIRYAQLLKKLGATVICQCQKPLIPLLRLCPYIDYCNALGDKPPHHDFQVPLTYLPDIFLTRIDTIPQEMPYLFARNDLEKKWNKIRDPHTCVIGICWHGADRNDPQMHLRSIPLKLLEPLLSVPHTTFYSLQQLEGTEQIAELSNTCVLHTFDSSFDKTEGSFMDTAAVINNLDLVITIDTSIAHLAGALNVPVWVMLPYANEWRFLTNRTDSPWYSSMRLFRQSTRKCWDEVVTDVMDALNELIKTKRA